MNISTPIGTEIVSVNFGFYSEKDVENISVRQIVNPTVFDNLGHPTKGGLYDEALGPFLGRSSCKTCHLDERFCPGHFGHIVLPQPVYHPLLFKSMMVLLKATCLYCHHFRLKTIEVHRYACKLKLLSRGLVLEAQMVDEIGKDTSAVMRTLEVDGNAQEEASESEEDDDEEAIIDRLIKKREKFVRAALRKASTTTYIESKTAAAAEERKEIVKECLKALSRTKRCGNCEAASPGFKHEENTKVFELALGPKEAKYMAGKGMTRVDVNMDNIKKPLSNGTASQDILIEPDSDFEAESGEDVMSDVEEQPRPKKVKEAVKEPRRRTYVLSTAVRNHLRRLFEKEASILALLFNVSGSGTKLTADNFFLSVIAVPPTRYRPPAREGDTIRESPQNAQLTRILNTCQRIAELNIRREQENETATTNKYQYLHQQIGAFIQLQLDVNSLLDSNASLSMADRLSGRTPPAGIKQTLEKKEGLFRKHMMGKRVNYAARSVISPDPNIETNEIGIPPFIAQKLTFPEPVTPHNVEKLRRAVINGPRTYPGASHVESDDGKITNLEYLPLERRTALANTLLTPDATQTRLSHGNTPPPAYLNKKVHRHLENGDILLVNRQPTLHKPSIMGHKAKVLTHEKTIRLHYANCNTYNADFDGDEMNVHFPQNSLARAEAYNIANTDNQYLGPTNGNPLRGLIQDHISVAVWMTKRDTFFTRAEYQQLLYGSIQPEEGGCGGHEGRIITLPPTIMKPRQLWSGKQVVSSLLMNLTPTDRPGLFLKSKSQVKRANWAPPTEKEDEEWKNSEEQEVVFDDGELLCGILDKAQIGPSAYGMVHSVYEIYGPDVAGKLLSAMGRLFTKYSQMVGLSCGMDDIRISQQGREARKRILSETVGVGEEVAIEYVGLKESYNDRLFRERMEEVTRDPEKLAGLDRAMQGAASELTSAMYSELVPVHLIKKFPKNNMQNMTESKAKGSSDNASLISGIIGQQSLEGGRVPIMISGKTLPSFPAYDTDIRAGGYVTSCYLTGIRPQEYFFYCMAGREGLIDTAVKTSRSGYLQRCLVKHLEGMTVHYDNTVRDSDGSLIQFLYGEDGLDVVKQKHLLDFDFSAQNWRSLISKYAPKNAPEWLADKTAGKYAKKAIKKPQKYDPVLSKFSPSRNLGSTSENFYGHLESFIEVESKSEVEGDKASERKGLFAQNSEDLTAKKFRALMELKYLRSLIDPGEAVGVLAAQSIGEPSTQMTLNTFHLAGFGAGNVTLGVPRLREIIMVASRKIKTPNVTLTMLSTTTDELADKLAKQLNGVLLSEVVDEITVTEKLEKDKDDEMSGTKLYVLKFKLYPRKEYEEEYMITQDEVETALSTRFLLLLAQRIKTTVKKSGGRKKKVGASEATPNIGQGKKRRNANDEVDERIPGRNNSEESDDDDNDADHQKRRRQVREQGEYEAPDEDDRAVIRQEDAQEDSDLETDAELRVNWRVEDEQPRATLDEKLAKIDLSDMQLLNPNLKSFTFDKKKGKWCEIELEYPLRMGKILMENVVEWICRKCVIREIRGMKRCVKMPKKKYTDPTKLVAEGRNLQGLWELSDLVDLNSLFSNDIGAIMDTYGVEAGRATIINEIKGIFSMYSITVDPRHLTLIADYMTFGGGYKPFNRLGLDSNVSPFLKMSFEQTCGFLTKATLEGDEDRLETPSARLVMGRSVTGGTGSFDILTAM